MSRRITYSSQITDRDLAISALKIMDMSYQDIGQDRLQITSGPLNRATINLKTGEVESDTDFHSKDDLGGLRQAYSEAEVTRAINREGAQIESRKITQAGDVKILCRMHG